MTTIFRKVLLLCACAMPFAAFAQKEVTYKLRPLDVIEMRVFQEQDMDTLCRVSATGEIVLPLINSVKVAGLSLQDAQRN